MGFEGLLIQEIFKQQRHISTEVGENRKKHFFAGIVQSALKELLCILYHFLE